MISSDERHVVILNGEIYNFPELRAEQEALGQFFRGSSDTEVLVNGIARWGVEAMLAKLVGMYVFAVWDRHERTLTIARDRLGEKPVCYGWAGRTFVFGSTVDSLAAHPEFRETIDQDALTLYFQTKAVPAPHTIFEDARKLEPGHLIVLTQDDLHQRRWPMPKAYWSLDDAARGSLNPQEGSDQEILDELERVLTRSIRGSMLSDVPLGAFLSGGIDSSSVVALLQRESGQRVKTFTIGFETRSYNEAPDAAAIARHLGTDHHETILTERETLDLVPQVASFYDEPFADSSQIPTTLVAKIARKHVTVALSGDGGDEVFCGYNRHVQLSRLYGKLRPWPVPLRRMGAALLSAVPTSVYETFLRQRKTGVLGDQIQKLATIMPMASLDQMYMALTDYWPNPEQIVRGARKPESLLSSSSAWPKDLSPLMQLMWVEAKTSLPDDMLVKVDRAGMAWSLESRMPILDHRVVEFAWSMPDRFRIRDGVGKWALRQVLYRYVPQTLMDRPKSGFGVPVDEWLRGPLRDWAEPLLDPRSLESAGLNPGPIRACWDEHLSGRRKWQNRLWTVLMYQMWRQNRAAKVPASLNAAALI